MSHFIFIFDPHPLFALGLKELLASREQKHRVLILTEIDQIHQYATTQESLILFIDLNYAMLHADSLHQIQRDFSALNLIITLPAKAASLNPSGLSCHYTFDKTAGEETLMLLMNTVEEHFFDVENTELSALLSVEQPRSKLTPRDYELLSLVAKGLSNRTMSRILFLSEKTVKNNLTKLYRKIGAKNRVEAAGYAITHGFYQKSPEEEDA